ncbi:MAG: leucine-rich repeat domain-containing protein [Candidatus Hodarchaeales archaeon]|jgi:small GTP-binding protein
MESEYELLQRIKEEFDNSAGTLTLSIKEFTSYFDLNETATKSMIKKLLHTGHYELIKEWNNASERENERIQIKQSYARNYWVKAELIEKEAQSLLEIGKLLKIPFNTRIKHITSKDSHLIKLDLRDQQLKDLPGAIEIFTHLKELRLQNNKLTQLPETIGNLKQLKILDLDRNSLTSLPDSIGELHALEELWVRENQLYSLPNSLKTLKNLKICSLQGNNALPKSKWPKMAYNAKSRGWIPKPSILTPKQPQEYLLKICCIGSVDDLKTEFIRRFADNVFDVNYLPTQGVDITTKRIEVNNQPIKLILVDTAGQEFFGKLRPSYYRGASALIIFFDKGDRQSFDAVLEWKKEFKKWVSIPIPITIVGFQAESEEVTREEAEQLALQLNTSYFECLPSQSGKEVDHIFQDLARKVIEGD